MNKIGEKLQEYRVKNNKTQLEIADSLGITQVHVSRVEQGKARPSASLVNRIASLIGEPINLSKLQNYKISDKNWNISYFVMGDMLSGDRVIVNNKTYKDAIYIIHVDSEGHNTAAKRASDVFRIAAEAIICSSLNSELTTPSYLLRSLDGAAKNLKEDWTVSSSCNIFNLKKEKNLLSFINAGMPGLYFYNASKRVIERLDGITKVKPVRELSSNQGLADTYLVMNTGDILASFSDGFLEFFGRVFSSSIDEYLATFSRTLRGDAEGLGSKILKDMVANENKVGSSDDISFVIIGKN